MNQVAVWGFVMVIGLVMAFVSGLRLADLAKVDVNRDARALLNFTEGAEIKVQIPGEAPVGYFVKISESAYQTLKEKTGYIRIGPSIPHAVTVEEP